MSLRRFCKDMLFSFYFLLRVPFILLIKFLFHFPARPVAGEVKKALIIRIDRMGDFVLTLPVIDNLRIHYPHAQISVLVRPYLAGLARRIKAIDEVIVYDNLYASWLLLGRQHFDIAMDMLFDYRLKSALLCWFTAAPVRAGFPAGFRELLFTHTVKREAIAHKDIVQLHLELLRSLGIEPRVVAPRIELRLNKDTVPLTVGVHPGGYYASQRWGLEKFSALIKKIISCFEVRVLVIASADEEGMARNIVKQAGVDKVTINLPQIDDLPSVLSECCLLVCNNSGPLHLAAAMGVPTVSMTGPTDSLLFRPHGENNIVIGKDLPCSPCGRAVCKKHDCLDAISVEEVFLAVSRLLNEVYGVKSKENACI